MISVHRFQSIQMNRAVLIPSLCDKNNLPQRKHGVHCLHIDSIASRRTVNETIFWENVGNHTVRKST